MLALKCYRWFPVLPIDRSCTSTGRYEGGGLVSSMLFTGQYHIIRVYVFDAMSIHRFDGAAQISG